MQLVQKDLKDVGIDAKIDQKEYGAYIATCFYGKFDSMTYGPQTPFLDPDNFLFGQYYPGRAQEPEPHQRPGGRRHARPPAAHVRHRQAARGDLRDPAPPGQAAVLRRRCLPASTSPCGRARIKNYAPNMGYDYGGRLHGGLARSLGRREARPGESRAQAVRGQAAAGRDPVAADRVADRLHAAAAHPRRRGAAHAGREGVRQGHRRAAGQARPGPAPLRAVFRVGSAAWCAATSASRCGPGARCWRRSASACPSRCCWPSSRSPSR